MQLPALYQIALIGHNFNYTNIYVYGNNSPNSKCRLVGEYGEGILKTLPSSIRFESLVAETSRATGCFSSASVIECKKISKANSEGLFQMRFNYYPALDSDDESVFIFSYMRAYAHKPFKTALLALG